MAKTDAKKRAQAKYEKKRAAMGIIKGYYLKCHAVHDADIIAYLSAKENVNGYIKELIRKDNANDKAKKYLAIFHQAEEGGYWGEFQGVEGCYTQGETVEEAIEMAKETLLLGLDLEKKASNVEIEMITGNKDIYVVYTVKVSMTIDHSN